MAAADGGALSARGRPGAVGLAGGLEEAWRELLSFQQERERRIAQARTFATGRPMTLRELGEEFGITRERVRQIERRMHGGIEQRLADDPACAPVIHLAARLRDGLGTVASEESVRAALVQASPDGEQSLLHRAVLLALAGPYRLSEGLWQRGNKLADLRAALAERPDEPLTEAQLGRMLGAAGVLKEHRAACLAALPVRHFEDRVLVWNGSLAEKAARVLTVHDEPMSRGELSDAVGADVNARSLMVTVQEDRRFRRVSLHSYGLAEWGEDEYATIADEIQRAIERRGGRAALDELVDELVDRFGVAPSSVRSGAGTRRFRRLHDGAVVIAADPQSSGGMGSVPPGLDRGLVHQAGTWTIRLIVEKQILRGSGRPLRTAIAQAAGVPPGGARNIKLTNGSLQISWRSDRPALSSTLPLVRALGCRTGDHLFLPLQDGRSAYAVTRAEVQAARGVARLALELGLPPDADLATIAQAIGLADDAGAADIQTRLRARCHADVEQLAALTKRLRS